MLNFHSPAERFQISDEKTLYQNDFAALEKDKDITNRTRFTYIGDVVNGLNQFEKTLQFCLKPKSETPIRKQKRNDNQ